MLLSAVIFKINSFPFNTRGHSSTVYMAKYPRAGRSEQLIYKLLNHEPNLYLIMSCFDAALLLLKVSLFPAEMWTCDVYISTQALSSQSLLSSPIAGTLINQEHSSPYSPDFCSFSKWRKAPPPLVSNGYKLVSMSLGD